MYIQVLRYINLKKKNNKKLYSCTEKTYKPMEHHQYIQQMYKNKQMKNCITENLDFTLR